MPRRRVTPGLSRGRGRPCYVVGNGTGEQSSSNGHLSIVGKDGLAPIDLDAAILAAQLAAAEQRGVALSALVPK